MCIIIPKLIVEQPLFLFQIIALFAQIYFLLEPMVLSALYVWCQLNKDVIVQFWFGTQFKAMYLPWILVAFNMILRGGYVPVHWRGTYIVNILMENVDLRPFFLVHRNDVGTVWLARIVFSED